jgi:hypothetical protein
MSSILKSSATTKRKALKASASMLGLAAGAVGWSGLAHAASEENGLQTLLLLDHYRLMDDGVVVFKLEGGEELSLTSDQYLIMQDGLLLITDELAQASVYSLPVMGSVRAHLLSDLDQVATVDGTVAEATPAQTLSISEGQAPHLSEQVELQSYEVAQSADASNDDSEGLLPLSLPDGASFMLLAAGLMLRGDQGEAPYWFNTADWSDSDFDFVVPNVPVGRDMPERLVGVPGIVVGFNDPDGYSAVYFGHSRQDALASTDNLLINPEDNSLASLYVYVRDITVVDGGEVNPTEVDGSFFLIMSGVGFWNPGTTGYDPGTFSTIFALDYDEIRSSGWSDAADEMLGDIWNFEVVVEDQSGNSDVWDLTLDWSESVA